MKIIINKLQSLPYFITIGKYNSWESNIIIEKPQLVEVLKSVKWEWELEESFISDNIYTLIINIRSKCNTLIMKNLPMKFGVYITKEIYDYIYNIGEKYYIEEGYILTKNIVNELI